MAHLENHIHNKHLVNDSTLHVIGVCSNPVRYHSRYRLARQWLEEMEKTPNVKAYLVEAAFGDRHHEVTVADNEQHLQLRTNTEIWIKENMINLGVRDLVPRTAKYICWEDADVTHRDPNWALETIHQLQHWPVVQTWSQCADLGPHGNIMEMHQSFGYVHQTGRPKVRLAGNASPYVYAHSGFSWACTRPFWEQAEGLIDFAVLGAGDHHMAWSMIGDGEWTVHKDIGASYLRRVKEWQQRAVRVTRKQVGFVPGRIEHHFHGSKKARQYVSRWDILKKHKFDPDQDLVRDAQGLIRLAGKPELEQAIRVYNRSRNEDGVDE